MNLWRVPNSEYKGLEAQSSPGTHEAATEILLRHQIPQTGVLDLASGSGALLARLHDNGFDDLHAIELAREVFALKDITPHYLNLNSDFALQMNRRFNVVTAIEIIEHLENPRHFLRQIRLLLEDRGFLLVSTPNISHWLGRIKFALTGDHRMFEASQYHLMRHITPITDTQMRLMLKEIGFDLVDVVSVGSYAGPLRRVTLLPASFLFWLLFGKKVLGDVTIYLTRKGVSRHSLVSHHSTNHRAGEEH